MRKDSNLLLAKQLRKMKSINIYKEQTMTSLEIAELTGKQHKDVMKAIRNMEPAWLKVNGRKFALVEYQAMATMECGLTVKQQEKLVPIIAHSWAMK